MGSSYFYMEFLLAWVSLLEAAGFQNPALFALDYTLVPDAVYPRQLQETYFGYLHVLSIVKDPSRICVSGDSAGATLILSFLRGSRSFPRRTETQQVITWMLISCANMAANISAEKYHTTIPWYRQVNVGTSTNGPKRVLLEVGCFCLDRRKCLVRRLGT